MPLSLLLPSSLTQDVGDPRARTIKVGTVGRAASIFGVSEIVLYQDPAYNDARFIEKLLTYQECPPYLRKRLFGLSPELEFAGLLPPLNTPAHVVGRQPRAGELREGVALRGGVEIGTDRLAQCDGPVEEGERLTVRVKEASRKLVVEPVEDPPADYYAGYVVRREDTLARAAKGFDFALATSKSGSPVTELAKVPPPTQARVAVAFGSAEKGLKRMLEDEGSDDPFDLWVNAFSVQRTRTVRTEEAVLAVLALLHVPPQS